MSCEDAEGREVDQKFGTGKRNCDSIIVRGPPATPIRAQQPPVTSPRPSQVHRLAFRNRAAVERRRRVPSHAEGASPSQADRCGAEKARPRPRQLPSPLWSGEGASLSPSLVHPPRPSPHITCPRP